jgi:AP2-associated kinase
VYLVKLARPVNGLDVAVLKRVAVPDKEALANMRTEVETMVGSTTSTGTNITN